MTKISQTKGAMSLSAYPGDAKILLSFDLRTEEARKRLAGFTIHVEPESRPAYYLWNNLAFARPGDHAQVAGEPAFSTANAPIHKFRWVHVPGLDHQGLAPAFGHYRYTVTPRYFDEHGRMLPLDGAMAASVVVPLQPFDTGRFKLGFTRGFVQSQAFVRHFGPRLPTRPRGGPLAYDTSQVAGTDPAGHPYSYAEQYRWLGFTARDRLFEMLDAAEQGSDAKVDVFAYDLNEPDMVARLLRLGAAGKVRIILDKADLHHDPVDPTPEDEFERLFTAAAGKNNILRGRFGRYAHNKVIVLYQGGEARRVLTGSTNFSVTGLYVNANHVIVVDDRAIAGLYAQVFAESWSDGASRAQFAQSPLGAAPFPFTAHRDVPKLDVSFSPHPEPVAAARLDEIVARCRYEADAHGSVFFAVMELGSKAKNPVYEALNQLHRDPDLFSYGISDNPDGIVYYPVGSTGGVLVTGKPGNTELPPPFSQVPSIGGGHQIHHKFVACGFGGPDPVVFCGSSNLALAGEQVNGDNLLAIHDGAVVTAFVIEALLLIDHFNFLDKTAKAKAAEAPAGAGDTPRMMPPPADKRAAAARAGWFLGTTDAWAAKYFDPADLHSRDRAMFA